MVYDKTNDSQEGAISMLIEGMEEQQLKEAVMAYTMLYLSGGPSGGDDSAAGITEGQLDRMCEDFLLQHFGLKVSLPMHQDGWRVYVCIRSVGLLVYLSENLDSLLHF